MQSASANDSFLRRIAAHFGRLLANSPETAVLRSVFTLAGSDADSFDDYPAVHRRKDGACSRRAQMTASCGE